MARQARLIIPGVAVHIVQRRVDRTACFREDTDRMVYLTALRELLKKTRCALHAYCLMTNHVHLLLTPPDEAACGTLMRDLGRKYVRYFNDRYERTGTLWEGRFHSCPVDSREYVLDCYRYIELNPVRARMAQQGSDYPWSSHRANALGGDDPSLTPHIEYTALGIDRTARLAAYRDFCSAQEQAGFLSAIREATHGGYPLVATDLRSQLQANGCRVARAKPGPRAKAGDVEKASGELEL